MAKPAKNRTRRRFWQYSLRSLGLLLLLCALLLGGWNHYFVPYRRQAEAIGQLNDIGAAIQTAPGGPEWLRQMFGEDQFIDVVRVDLEHKRDLKDEDLDCLQHLVNLKRLYLAATPVGDDGLRWARHLKGLERLSLWRTNVTDAGMEHLARLENLELIDLHSTTVTNAGITKLNALPNLKRLRLFPDYYPPVWMSRWQDFPDIPAGPMRAETREILERAVTKATAGDPDLQRENLAALKRLAALDWPKLQSLRYVKLQHPAGARQTSVGGSWLLDDDGEMLKRLGWNLVPEFYHPSNVSGVTDADFKAELSPLIDLLRADGVDTPEEAPPPPTRPSPLFLLGVAYAAAEQGLQAEAETLLGELFDQQPGGLPELADPFVRLRLGLGITGLTTRLLRTEGDGAPHWRRFLAQCRGLRDAFPESGYRAQLDSIIGPLERDLASAPPAGADPLALAVYQLRDRPRAFDGRRRIWEGPMGRLVDAGSPSIPYLIEALEDRTPTACARGWYPPPNGRPLISLRADLPEPVLISRRYLAMECLERIVGVNFVSPHSLRSLSPLQRDTLLGAIRRWWRLSEGKSQADMLRNYLEVFERTPVSGAAAYQKDSRFNAWKLIGELEGPEAVLQLAGRFPRDAGFEQRIFLNAGATHVVRIAFENLRAGTLRPEDLEHLLRHGDRRTYQQLAAVAEDPQRAHALLPHLTAVHLNDAAATGQNWAIPLMAAALQRTQLLGRRPESPSSLADAAAVHLARLISRHAGEAAEPIVSEAVAGGVFRRDPQGQLIIADPVEDFATRQAAIRKARAWWLESGREGLAEVVARDHPIRFDAADLTWPQDRVESTVSALTCADDAARREAISGLRHAFSYPVQQALLSALDRETDTDVRLEILALIKPSVRLWHLPALTARLADRAEDPRVRIATADALSTSILSARTRERYIRLETWQAALAVLRAVLRDNSQPLELRRRVFDILSRWRDPVDTPLLTGINDGIAESLRDGTWSSAGPP